MDDQNSLKKKLLNLLSVLISSSRTGDYAGTSRQLNIFLNLLEKILSSGKISSKQISQLTYSLETLLAMQQMENWVAFADILEYELTELLKAIPD